jgi:hypothetical protein
MSRGEITDILRAYGSLVSESDAAQAFHFWTAIGSIAGAAQRKIFMRPAHYYVHTNMYILLVAPPGRGKKTTALDKGRGLLRAIEPQLNFAAEAGSFEGLVSVFSKIANPAHQSLTLFASELGVLLSTNPATMIEFLNSIYDGRPDWQRTTVKHDLQQITRPWLTIMAATTPKWFSDNAKLLAADGGFLARMIIPYSEERLLENPFPILSPELTALEEAITQALSHIATLEFEFTFDGGKGGEAYQWYDAWYRNPKRFPEIDDPRTASYYDRKHIHLLKVAMALSLSYKDDPVLTVKDLETALALLDRTEPGRRIALRALGKNEWAEASMHIMSQIQSKHRMTTRELIIDNIHNIPKKKLDELLEELIFMGKITYKDGYWLWKTAEEAEA